MIVVETPGEVRWRAAGINAIVQQHFGIYIFVELGLRREAAA